MLDLKQTGAELDAWQRPRRDSVYLACLLLTGCAVQRPYLLTNAAYKEATRYNALTSGERHAERKKGKLPSRMALLAIRPDNKRVVFVDPKALRTEHAVRRDTNWWEVPAKSFPSATVTGYAFLGVATVYSAVGLGLLANALNPPPPIACSHCANDPGTFDGNSFSILFATTSISTNVFISGALMLGGIWQRSTEVSRDSRYLMVVPPDLQITPEVRRSLQNTSFLRGQPSSPPTTQSTSP